MIIRNSLAAVLAAASFSASALCPSNVARTTPSEGFVNNGDGTVSQVSTGLTWDICALGQTYDASIRHCVGQPTTMAWSAALDAPNQANSQSRLGKSDWRLPNIKELSSIVERGCYEPSINGDVFADTPTIHFWANTPQTAGNVDPDAPLKYVNFKDGLEFDPAFAGAAAVRLVRERAE